ncbi:MAG: T9SS type A sorting domain-containing protein [Bacteroidia bacterium]|nr:T9SS type A sorting domain-containing protein [Bacteroidia bacterium]MBT8276035.1 T9SS type A sorting domain-containing protein [Bacteroidia bacterium]NNF29985.1 T9SS type A sorting domain-containing protein [Flavobacteriaceae bacterium]NNJ80882.1 T9SS type A sorting domain-containing protein [Flavobacteriaceae bacterium]NNM09289.1 T9SS type A sorting domain-containing protein [Flavobacteriaceae bacterium]
MKSNRILTLLFLFSLSYFFGNAQTIEQIREMHNEVPDDPYTTVDKSRQARTPAYKVRTAYFFTTQVNVDADGNNIVGDAGNETSIAIDPTNPNRIAIGWRQFDDVGSNFRQAGYGYSLDGGYNFTFPGVLNPGVFRSDPVLDFDSDGNFYYNSLRGTFDCDVFKITDGGTDWGSPVPARGGDKQWMTLDKSGGSSAGHNYSYWNTSFTTCAPGAFTRSTDGSNSFEDCEVIDNEPFWGTMKVDGNGDLYMVGRNGAGSGMVVVKSTNAKDPGEVVDWDFVTPVDLDGVVYAQGDVNPAGLVGQAWIDTDNSGGSGDGNVYVLGSVLRSGGDPADVMFARSTDGGLSFEPPVRVNIDTGNTYQWFGTMSVAPNGRIDVVYLDTSSAGTGSVDSRLIYCWSDDQGDTWNDYLMISEMFDPTIGYPNQNKMGDYYDMKSDNDYAHLAWCNTLNGGQDAYYTRISPEGILGVDDIALAEGYGFISYPNPFSEETTLQFYTGDDQAARMDVYNMQGQLVNTLFDDINSGTTKVRWDGTNGAGQRMAEGLYFVALEVEGTRSLQKVILKK